MAARESADEESWPAQDAVREQALDKFLRRLRQTRVALVATE